MERRNMLSVDRAIAKQRLANRWLEQCDANPTFARGISLERYIAANLSHVMRNGLLASYSVRN